MTDWDEIRYFLAVARAGTMRGAAERLAVNHSTVLRRIGQLEGKLGVLLFDRLPSGYRLSAAGEEVFELAEEMENLAGHFEARIAGRDQAASGPLRVARPPTIATYLLTPDFAAFARLHPEIGIEVLGSNEPVNLTNRDADVAIRVVYDRNTLPLNLHGIKGPQLCGAIYISRDLLAAHEQRNGEPIRWIVKIDHGVPDWAHAESLPIASIPYTTSDTEGQIAALHEGLGIAALSCFVGDADPASCACPARPFGCMAPSGC